MKNNQIIPRIHLACAEDEYRPIFNYVMVTKDHVVATDAHILVVYKTPNVFSKEFINAMPERFLVHKRHWALMCKPHVALVMSGEYITCFRSGIKDLYPIVLESDNVGKIVDWHKIIPEESTIKEVPTIGINPSLMGRLAKCMFTRHEPQTVALEFHGAQNSIVVRPKHSDSCYAILMPCML